jgi:uncharacterized membrane protein YwzB
MKALDKFKLKIKQKEFKKITWNFLLYYAISILGVFFLMTCITFWINQGINFPELRGKISQMLLFVLFGVLIISIEGIRSIFKK